LDGEFQMTDVEDLKLKAEIDEIMKSVDNIMEKVETVIPSQQEESQTPGE
jgi:hypothetical protein